MQSEFEFLFTETLKVLTQVFYLYVFFVGGLYLGYLIGRLHGRDDD